ncbi:MAG: DNA-processing protein DprA [Deltaproteobacteria bacterium]|nr:DNA-processing protein DprA [Deltaproteobacteria bacterium]MBI2229940.1 DNA-processing protein DprA [Deltaproteobacteria bacterium]MBI2364989.1 DNA-processing protein DprA [Deltaproteobacteria bacterium]MBI2532609.1 DNA-processing protein DprA [Deltaproteobacteria bacterium]
MVKEYEILEIRPPPGLESFFDGKPPTLWGLGEPAILERKLLGIISARQIDSDLALKSSQLLKQLAFLKEVSFISGWHSPLEEEALNILLAQEAAIVFCVPKSLNRFVPCAGVKDRVSQGEALLLTHCSPRAKRISRDASLRRNELVAVLAAALLVLSAPQGSASLKLAKSALRYGKPVLTPEHRMNKELLGCNALPATFDNIQAALR